jgi:hypothetical protein
VSFNHVYRPFNVSAHTLARSAEHLVSVIFTDSPGLYPAVSLY